MNLINLQPVIDIVSLALQTAFIKNSKVPISLLLVSDPESAKTTALDHLSGLDFVGYYDEITAKQIIDQFLPQVRQNKLKYLVIPDLINCIDKQKNTRNQFLSLIKSGIDDTGIKRISSAYKSYELIKGEEGTKFGIISAITGKNFNEIRRYLVKTGLLSRFVPFSYNYPINMIIDVINYIAGNRTKHTSIKVPKINAVQTDIKGRFELYTQLTPIATEIGHQYEGYGIRAQINLQKFADASALINHRRTVTQRDIDNIKSLSKWMNYKFEMIV